MQLQRLQKLVETLTVTQLETLTVVKRLEEQIQSLQKVSLRVWLDTPLGLISNRTARRPFPWHPTRRFHSC